MISKSLMIQLSLAIVLITTAVLAGFGVFRYRENFHELTNKLEQNLDLTAKRLSISLRTPIFNYAEYETRDIILSEMEDQNIVGMMVFLREDTIPRFAYIRTSDNKSVSVNSFVVKKEYVTKKKDILYGADKLGEVTIYMTKKYLKEQLAKNLFSDIIQILLLDVVLIFLVILLLRSRFVLPITKLTSVAKEISKGELDQSIDVKSNDEIGVLAQSFTIMRDAIQRQIVDLNNEIEERKEVEEKLRHSEKRFRQLSNATWEAIVIHEEGVLLQANDLYYEMFGYTQDDLLGKMALPLTVTSDSFGYMKEIIASGKLGPYEVTGKKKNGTEFPIEIRIRVMDYHGRKVRVAAIRDLTQQKKNEQKIADALEFVEKIIYESPIGISIYDSSGKCIAANEAVGKIVGTTREQVLAQNYHNIESWKESGLLDRIKAAIKDNQIKRSEVTAISTFGKKVFLDCHVVPFFSEEKIHILLMVNDISERMHAEEELKHLRNYLKNIVDSMPSILVGVDTKGQITQWNLEAEKVTGISSDQAQGKVLNDVFPQMSHAMENVWHAVNNRQVRKDLKIPLRIEGEIKFSDITIYPLVTNGVEGAVIRVDDITERVRIEEMIVQSEKMLSVGGLAAGMAHEINNPLAGILQNIQVLRNRMVGDLSRNRAVAEACGISMQSIVQYAEKRGMLSMIEMIMDAGKRAAKIVENMLTFSRKSQEGFALYDMADLLDRTIELAGSDYDLKKKYDFRQIKIIREYDETLPKIACEQSKIQQVILNVLKNGAFAMTEPKNSSKPSCFVIRLYKEGEKACIEIEDNGTGMDEATRKRVFEPFFTTKQVGSGTGLGLSISYFIITENHGGEMAIESSPDNGAKFIIRLPFTRKIEDSMQIQA